MTKVGSFVKTTTSWEHLVLVIFIGKYRQIELANMWTCKFIVGHIAMVYHPYIHISLAHRKPYKHICAQDGTPKFQTAHMHYFKTNVLQ